MDVVKFELSDDHCLFLSQRIGALRWYHERIAKKVENKHKRNPAYEVYAAARKKEIDLIKRLHHIEQKLVGTVDNTGRTITPAIGFDDRQEAMSDLKYLLGTLVGDTGDHLKDKAAKIVAIEIRQTIKTQALEKGLVIPGTSNKMIAAAGLREIPKPADNAKIDRSYS